MTLHILPINDLKEHEESSICDCTPELIIENVEMILVHNAYDNREIIEEVNEVLNNKKLTTVKRKLNNEEQKFLSKISKLPTHIIMSGLSLQLCKIICNTLRGKNKTSAKKRKPLKSEAHLSLANG